jgi:hypothetical protein
MPLREALAPCLEPANLRRTLTITAAVGLVFTLVNQLGTLLDGKMSAITALRIAFNFAVPFVVSNLGVLAATRTVRQS